MDNPLITKAEREILDVRHRSFPLLQLPEDQAITRLLKVAGDILRECVEINDQRGLSRLATGTFVSTLHKALSHCIRWVGQDCVPDAPTESSAWEQEDVEAAELLGWGMQYAQLTTSHVAWRQGLIGANVDPVAQTITFEPDLEMDLDYFTRESHADFAWWREEANDLYPLEAVSNLFHDWHCQITWGQSGLDFPLDLIRNHPSLPDIQRWVRIRLFPELEDNCLLGQYRLSDLRHFYAHLFGLCECIRILEDRTDKKFGQDNPMGTWTLQDARPSILAYMEDLTGLPTKALDPIVRDMTLNTQRFHCSVTATPFVHTRRGRLFLLPRLFAYLSPQRTVACALTSGTGRSSYDRISTTLEEIHLTMIGEALCGCGFIVHQERVIITPRGDKIQPDFLVSDGITPDLLVIDYKNALAATAVAEVTNRLKEYRKGVRQIEGYLDAFVQYPDLLRSSFGMTRPLRLSGMLLLRVPMPLPISKGSRVAVENWHTLLRRIVAMKPTRVADLLPRPTILEGLGNPVHQLQEIRVDDWTYRRPVLFFPNA